jgi:uncharacterized protein YeaO (DUF488 family)
MGRAMTVQIKRIYEPGDEGDGTRILVDRLWPRGLRKTEAHVDIWMKDIAPSPELRRWFGHDPAKWDEFRRRYTHELQENPSAVDALGQELHKGNVTLLYAARDEKHNHAVVLAEFLATHSR